jgi:AAT family amino acid transporter/GABA permease
MFTTVNLVSVRSYGEFEFWFASIKVAAVMLFIVAGVFWLGGVGRTDATPLPLVFSYAAIVPNGPLSILASIPAVIFGICGSEIAVIAAGESNEPLLGVSRLAVSVIVRILVFYLGSMLVIVAIVPWQEVMPGTSPYVTALQRMQVPFASEAMNLIVLTAILSCLNSGIYVASRVILGLSRKGDAPAGASRTNRAGVPVGAVLFSAGAAYAILLVSSLSYEALFTFLLNASGAVMLLAYMMIAFAQMRNRYAMSAETRAGLPVRMRLFPGLTIAVIVAIIAILVAMVFDPAMQSQVYATTAAVVAASVAYLLRRYFGSSAPSTVPDERTLLGETEEARAAPTVP